MTSTKEQIIGLRPHSGECLICNCGHELNEITMEILLSSKAPADILKTRKAHFKKCVGRFLTLDDLAIHAEHCDPAMVPPLYSFTPWPYDEEELMRSHELCEREEEEIEQARMSLPWNVGQACLPHDFGPSGCCRVKYGRSNWGVVETPAKDTPSD